MRKNTTFIACCLFLASWCASLSSITEASTARNLINSKSETKAEDAVQWVSLRANDPISRSHAVNFGISIESVVGDMSYGFAPASIVEQARKQGIEIVSSFPAALFRNLDFPSQDAAYHNYQEMKTAMDDLVHTYPAIAFPFSIGKSTENRDIVGIRINTHVRSFEEKSGLPGIVYMGGHHAREHLSMELPILYAKHLLDNYGKDATITRLLDSRDVFIIPMVNPDGAEWDLAGGSYHMWRKNRSNPRASCPGVDLNRNYGYQWGTGGSSTNACSDVFMGPTPFSEPETRAVKAFMESRLNIKMLLSFHTYSELILYPWGSTNDQISVQPDLNAFKTMANTMSRWNGYTAEQASDLYIASGDTVDWAYGTLGVFGFTFELSPKDTWGGGGFYPGVSAIQQAFQANLKPVLYLLDLADDPHRSSLHPETTLFFGQ